MADILVLRGKVGMPRGKAPRGPFAVDAHLLTLPFDGVLLDLGHVVRDIVHDLEADRLGALPQDLFEALADPVGDHLTVREGEVCRRGHGSEVRPALGGGERDACELAIRDRDPVAREGAAAHL